MNNELDFAIATRTFFIKRFGQHSPYTRTLESAIRVAFGQKGINALHNSSPYANGESTQSSATNSRVLFASGRKFEEPDAEASKKKHQERPEPSPRRRRSGKKGAADDADENRVQHQPTDAWPVEEE
ncbi:MAG: hypothetical protein QXR53_04970 [Candidatus Norongarragalinales archaeon]